MPAPNGQSTGSDSAATQKSQEATSQYSKDATNQLKPPSILWAQRADQILMTIEIEDCKDPIIKLEKDKLYFRGKSDSIQSGYDHNEHEVTIEFYNPINVDDSKHVVKARGIEFVIIKEESSWWPRLLKGTTKQHWLKIDFPKWKDEDDSDDEVMGGPGGMGGGGGQPDFGDFMQQFGNMGGAGMGGMPGMGGMGGMGGMPGMGDDEDFEESDDDDTDQIPELIEANAGDSGEPAGDTESK